MTDEGREDESDPGMAIPLCSSFGMVCGVALGLTLLDNVGVGIGVGTAIGTMLGTVVDALIQESEEPTSVRSMAASPRRTLASKVTSAVIG